MSIFLKKKREPGKASAIERFVLCLASFLTAVIGTGGSVTGIGAGVTTTISTGALVGGAVTGCCVCMHVCIRCVEFCHGFIRSVRFQQNIFFSFKTYRYRGDSSARTTLFSLWPALFCHSTKQLSLFPTTKTKTNALGSRKERKWSTIEETDSFLRRTIVGQRCGIAPAGLHKIGRTSLRQIGVPQTKDPCNSRCPFSSPP